MTDAPRLRRRKARKALGSAAWKNVRRVVLVRDLWTCRYCGDPADRVDHVIPAELAPALHNDPANLVAACRSCNISKRAMTIEEWYERAGKPLPSWYRPAHETPAPDTRWTPIVRDYSRGRP